MWDLVGNPEDRFSHNEAHYYVDDVLKFLIVMAGYTDGVPNAAAEDVGTIWL